MNKYLIKFPTPDLYTDQHVDDLLVFYDTIYKWVSEHEGKIQGFPIWQFSSGGTYFKISGEHHELYDGIYIFDDETRIAFRLRFGL